MQDGLNFHPLFPRLSLWESCRAGAAELEAVAIEQNAPVTQAAAIGDEEVANEAGAAEQNVAAHNKAVGAQKTPRAQAGAAGSEAVVMNRKAAMDQKNRAAAEEHRTDRMKTKDTTMKMSQVRV